MNKLEIKNLKKEGERDGQARFYGVQSRESRM